MNTLTKNDAPDGRTPNVTPDGRTPVVAPVGGYRWTILSLVFFATTVNYLDRVVISLLKGDLEKEFSWTESDYSNLVIVFQTAYAVGLLGVGGLIDRMGAKRGYAASLMAWSGVA
ncbi:MAG: hypothetical protein H7Z72_11050, partial [Bacteroidetes bacterium]|nr:hypothetical protein [Fibrella sp.]